MQLRKLEAYGFKSFADKTEVVFGEGITVIVGPNGSGKSNISDAIRWALGEQSIRTLRGTKSEDVIFSGSVNRRAVGMAEVSLTFDNTDGALAIDFNEVIITRRVFRSGESEYYINKSSCRLKDIHELLADTGLGRDAMPVIGQNKVDEVLNSKPEDRRLLFEEAAGITKYKQRKREALRKMEDTEHNLTRVGDIIAEIETQLEPLAESAARTERYNELHDELVACQVTLLLNKLAKAEKMVESAALQQQALTDDEIALQTKMTANEVEAERTTGLLAAAEEKITALDSAVHQAMTDLERMDGKTAVLDERMKQSGQAVERLAEQTVRLQEQQTELLQKAESVREGMREKEGETLSLEQRLAEQTVEQQNNAVKLKETEQRLEQGKEETFGHLQELVSAKNSLSTLERDLDRLKARQEGFAREKAVYSAQFVQTQKEQNDVTAEQRQIEEKMRCWQGKQTQLQQQTAKQEMVLNTALQAEKQVGAKLNEHTSRLKVLSSMQQEYEGFGRGIKSILKSETPWRSKVCGAVAEILTVPDKYVIAVEIALGGALQHVITQDDATAKQAIDFLKRQNLGRATFLPLNTIRPATPREFEAIAAKAAGALGFAADLVNGEEKYRSVIQFLLGRTVVAEDIDAALAIARKSSFGVKIVTLDGELINPGGSMTGGSTHRRETSFLSRHNEIETTQQKINEIKNRLAGVQNEIEQAKQELALLGKKAEALQTEQRSMEVRQAELAIHADKLQVEISKGKLALVTLTTEAESCAEEQTALAEKMASTGQYILMLENRDSAHKQQVADWQAALRLLQEEKERINAAITDSKIHITALKQELSAAAFNERQYRQDAGNLSRQLQEIEQDRSGQERQIAVSAAEIEELKTAREETVRQKQENERRRSEAQQEKMTLLTTLNRLEKELKDARRRLSDIQNRLHEMQLLTTKYSYEVTNCRELLQDHYGMNMEQAQALARPGSQEELTATVKTLEDEIAQLGPVNPAAIDEYRQVSERYQFLQKQSDDLVLAKEYLASVIADIDKTMSKQFTAAFQEINAHFSDTFVRLFGGGKAQLVLLEPDNMLETGIEIIVQPPGKKQQNLILLSGGERALTVIALLFSFLAYRPAPFTMVDEIDAPLDEANLQRFSDFLRDYAKQTQFIVVTHRKGTMEAADVIHGVTMEDSGVSKLVSVKLMDKAG